MACLVVFVGNAEEASRRLDRLLAHDTALLIVPTLDGLLEWLVQTLQHPNEGPSRTSDSLSLDGLEIDLSSHHVRCGGATLDLTEHELWLLATLGQNPGHAFSFKELLTAVWGSNYKDDVPILRAAVKRLRKKLGQASQELRIESVRGFGFRLAPHDSPFIAA